MRLAVVGSRGFDNYQLLCKYLDEINPGMIVSGGAIGADYLSQKWAKDRGKAALIFYPDWKGLGKQAGFIRNEHIIINSDKVIAFWDGKSKGTKNSIDKAESLGKELKIVLYEQEEQGNY